MNVQRNTILFAALCAALLFTRCSKELDPIGLVLKDPVAFKDTTYDLATMPPPQDKAVFIEEMTGVKCTNCPNGAAIIKTMQNQFPGRILVAKLHSNFLADPIKATDPDFRCADAETIDVGFGSSGNKPNALVDRTINTLDPGNNQYYANKGKWNQAITTQLGKATPVNIDLLSSLNAANDTVRLKSVFTFTQAQSDPLAFSIYLLEDDIEATQDSFFNGVFEIEGYIHEEVLRASITAPITGTSLPPAPYPAGRVYERSLEFAIPNNVINKAHIRAVVFVHGTNKGEVLQAKSVKL
jgi:hypothetical protein